MSVSGVNLVRVKMGLFCQRHRAYTWGVKGSGALEYVLLIVVV